ncbi:hypothetical protein [Streptomyces litchfieldiae]|uniref:Uncharacterized protein n=1 Tax=Streptomyces litchfieldiae TaxID=3075543 RepID=A0ABU2N0V6_9ACTN|nr:hypothetical protein [Streptomyces sp. DSM 44938]MDT0347537.1 hypothetical protein [Streptomyces sp. DSM 44938]
MTPDSVRPEPGTILTLEQVEPEATYYGVRVAACEDGEPLLAIGTHDLRRVIAAWSRYLREFCGETLRDYLSLCVPDCTAPWCNRYDCRTLRSTIDRPGWLVFRAPDPAKDQDPEYAWYFEVADADTLGAIPVVSV